MASKVMQSLALCQTVQKTLILSLRRQPLNLCGHAFRKIWTSRDLKPCSYCMLQHQRPIHLSAHVYAKNLRKRALKVGMVQAGLKICNRRGDGKIPQRVCVDICIGKNFNTSIALSVILKFFSEKKRTQYDQTFSF